MLEKALEYAEFLPVMPNVPLNKRPLIKAGAGFKNASQDPEQIKEWWTNNPDANIGVIPADSGFFVLDVDMPNGQHTMEELGIWKRLSEGKGFQAYVTPSGGFHFWWKTDSKIIMDKTIVGLWKDIDILSSERQVIVPPSQTKKGRYFEKIDFSKVPEVPDWLRVIIEEAILDEENNQSKSRSKVESKTIKNYNKSYTGALLDRIVEGVDDGERNEWLTSITGSLLNSGMNMKNTHVFLHTINQNYIDPSLTAGEVDTIFKSIASKYLQERAGK